MSKVEDKDTKEANSQKLEAQGWERDNQTSGTFSISPERFRTKLAMPSERRAQLEEIFRKAAGLSKKE